MLSGIETGCCVKLRGVVYARRTDDCCAKFEKLMDNAEVSLQPTLTRLRLTQRQRSRQPAPYLQSVGVRIVAAAQTERNLLAVLAGATASTTLADPPAPTPFFGTEFWPSDEGLVFLGAGVFTGVIEQYNGDGWTLLNADQWQPFAAGVQVLTACPTAAVRVTGALQSVYCVAGDGARPDLELRVFGTDCYTCTTAVVSIPRFSLAAVSDGTIIGQSPGALELRGVATGAPPFVLQRGQPYLPTDGVAPAPAPAPAPELTIGKSAGSSILALGAESYYVITVSNPSSGTAAHAVITDVALTLPGSPAGVFTFVEPFACSYGGTASGPSSVTVNNLFIGDVEFSLPPGGLVSIYIPFTVTSVPAPGMYVNNTARVSDPAATTFWESTAEVQLVGA